MKTDVFLQKNRTTTNNQSIKECIWQCLWDNEPKMQKCIWQCLLTPTKVYMAVPTLLYIYYSNYYSRYYNQTIRITIMDLFCFFVLDL